MSEKLRVSVLGGGSFGTAISNIIASNGHHSSLWMRDVERAIRCQEQRENSEYLPGYRLHDNLNITSDLIESVSSSDIVVISVPSKSVRQVTRLAAPYIPKAAIIVSTTKGIEEDSFCLMSQVLEQELDNEHIAALSGPNFAKEIIQNQYTGSVIACTDDAVCRRIQGVFSSKTFKVYSNPDRYGVELGGTLKNIYAIVSGAAASMGCGANTMAMILTRALAEMSRFANVLGGDSMTFLGLAGVGDLILTCTSDLSRNYRVGYAVGQGKNLETILEEMGQVAEGVNTLKIVKRKADELQVYMPMVQALYAVMFEGAEISQVIKGLMTGEMSSDVDLQGGREGHAS
ncbi:MAG: NAD(P)H-dependent glycerol-3-phosphate dehydrogenase [Alteromonadaceae bacterium]|nr:MAG: NAD(P)H-dependent glycerol-3-phosphate dehydrogenase [Alteromonadaceae bacterium]